MQCRARSKRTGERCKRHAKPGWEVCHYHGARGGRSVVHGRRSKIVWISMGARMAAGLTPIPRPRDHRRRFEAALARMREAGLIPMQEGQQETPSSHGK